MSAPEETEPHTFDPEVVSQSLIYNDYDLAWDIAHEIEEDMQTLLKLRDQHKALGEKDPEGVFFSISPALKRELGLGKYYGFERDNDESFAIITNRQARNSIVDEMSEVIQMVNTICDSQETSAEYIELEELLTDDARWTNAETKQIAGRYLSAWKRLSTETRADHIYTYAMTHPLVRGVRSATAREFLEPTTGNGVQYIVSPLTSLDRLLGKPEPRS